MPTIYRGDCVRQKIANIVLEWKGKVHRNKKKSSLVLLWRRKIWNIGQEQRNDPSISIIILRKETNVRPSHSEIATLDISAQIYWSYWDDLVIKDGILSKKWVASNLKTNVLQLVIPRHRVKEILEKAYDSLIGGHFGVNKTLKKI